jgi:putative SOS response-associated peptidase YedK
MCGRYTLRRPGLLQKLTYQQDFEEFSQIKIPLTFRPTNFVPVVRFDQAKERKLSLLSWGFIPFWNKGDVPKAKPFNVKSETVAINGLYREAFKRRRCLIPADGFFEPKGPKSLKIRQAYFFQRPDRDVFAFAGIWDRWKPPDTEPVDTCALLTIGPNDQMRPIHDRMPVILRPEDYDRWLDRDVPGEEVKTLLVPASNESLEHWQTLDQEKDPDDNRGVRPDVKDP